MNTITASELTLTNFDDLIAKIGDEATVTSANVRVFRAKPDIGDGYECTDISKNELNQLKIDQITRKLKRSGALRVVSKRSNQSFYLVK